MKLLDKRTKTKNIGFLRFMAIMVSVLFIAYPLGFTLLTSLKSKEAYILDPLGIDFTRLTLQNYVNIIHNFDFARKLGNTVIVVFCSVLILFLIAIPAAYQIISIRNLKIQTILTVLCFAFMFIPEEVLILPEYNMMSALGLINNYLSVIVSFVSSSLPEVLFMLTVYLRLIPQEVLQAAQIDGADHFQCLTEIVIPLSKSPIIVVIISTTISLWNSFLVPMLMLSDERYKMLLPSLGGLVTKHSTTPTYQMAGVFLSMIPLIVVYCVFKEQIFQNSIGGAVR